MEFWVGGYGSDRRSGHEVWKIEIVNGACGPPSAVVTQGATGLFFGGQIAPISRLVIGVDPSTQEVLIKGGMPADNAQQLVGYLQSKLEVRCLGSDYASAGCDRFGRFLDRHNQDLLPLSPGADIVGGDTDVAVVTKHEGFKWVRRKHYYPAYLNPLETDHAD